MKANSKLNRSLYKGIDPTSGRRALHFEPITSNSYLMLDRNKSRRIEIYGGIMRGAKRSECDTKFAVDENVCN